MSSQVDATCATNSNYDFVVVSRAKGNQLHKVWPNLSQEEKVSYVKQIVDALRSFTAEFPQRVDGSPLGEIISSPLAFRAPNA